MTDHDQCPTPQERLEAWELREALQASHGRTRAARRSRQAQTLDEALQQLRAGFLQAFVYSWLIPLSYRVAAWWNRRKHG